jgi:predicted NAD-dependent protein-ADP-ribosyltransferase YbiA (DUF1768 family)
MAIISFSKVALSYGWLGNMSPYPIIYEGKEWRTVEALFQSLRFTDENIIEAIRNEKSPMGAKMKAKSFKSSYSKLQEKKSNLYIFYKHIKFV